VNQRRIKPALRVQEEPTHDECIYNCLRDREREWEGVVAPDKQKQCVSYEIVGRRAGCGEIKNFGPFSEPGKVSIIIWSDVTAAK